MLYICSRCMKSVSELSLWVLSSRAFPFSVVRPLHLKTHLFVTETKEQALPFSLSSQRQKASLSSENAALVHCLFAVPEGQQ